MNFEYIVTFPDDAPDLMFLLMALSVYIFNSRSKKQSKDNYDDLHDWNAAYNIHVQKNEKHTKKQE